VLKEEGNPAMSPQSRSKIIGLVVVALLAVGGTGAVILLGQKNGNPDVVKTNDSDTSKTTTDAPKSTSTATYKDGTYSATGNYISPNGDEKVGVTVTLKNSIVESVSIETFGSNDEAKQYQASFKSGISNVVVGKNVNDVSVSRVASSSLTSTGFNRALETIKSNAKA
jgi:uncharacterized protein with FMN-binding domain